MNYDICIIGAGVVGSLIARQLSKYKVKIAVIERNVDVSMDATGANSGIVHSGYDAKIGTKKARFNVEGCNMMPALCEDLSVKCKMIGSFVLAFDKDDEKVLQQLYDNGIKNGVTGMAIVDRDFILQKEPYVNPLVTKALYAKNAGIVSPYKLNIAAMDNAIMNGVMFLRETKVTGIEKKDGLFHIAVDVTGDICSMSKIDPIKEEDRTDITAKIIINCAGAHADEISHMAGDDSFKIIPRRGEYILFDKTEGSRINTVLFQTPTEKGKGILVTPTVDGNLMIGPDATLAQDKDDKCTNSDNLDYVYKTATQSYTGLNMKKSITVFAGIRATPNTSDFIIEESSKCRNFINVAGIESPGLTASPAIAVYVESIVKSLVQMNEKEKDEYTMTVKHDKPFSEMTNEEKEKACSSDELCRKIICRCETVSEKEIVAAIYSPCGARTVDGVKKRTRAGMGRCQGGFCSPHVMRILSEHTGIPVNRIAKANANSCMLGRYSRG
jgi:glycerol-3-phosphate dehydrogenase